MLYHLWRILTKRSMVSSGTELTGRRQFYLICDGPDKATQLSCNGCDDHLFGLAFVKHVSVAPAQPQLGFPGDIPDVLREILLPLEQVARHHGTVPIGP